MCGIAGWYAKPGVTWRPSKQWIARILSSIQTRGTDATGLGTLKDDSDLYIYKGPISASQFNLAMMEEEVPIGRMGVLHTRGASVGEPSDNNNNHPLHYQHNNRNVMIVHNGGIGNLEDSYQQLGVDPQAEVDSALIAAAMGKMGPLDGLKFLERNSGGSAAFAAMYDDGSLVLAKDSNPLYIGIPHPGVIIWSSHPQDIKNSCYDDSMGVPIWRILEVPNQWYAYWGPDGNMIEEGRFFLPAMRKPPKYLRDTRYAIPVVNPPITPTPGNRSPLPLTASDADTERIAFYRRHNINVSNAEALERELEARNVLGNGTEICAPVVIPPDRRIVCHWAGCWKPSRFIRPFSGAYIPVCHTHHDKIERKGVQHLKLSPSGELSRKKQSVAPAQPSA